MQFALKCVIFQILVDKLHLYFCVPFPLIAANIYVFSYFPFGFEGRMWDLIASVPDYCLSFYFIF